MQQEDGGLVSLGDEDSHEHQEGEKIKMIIWILTDIYMIHHEHT